MNGKLKGYIPNNSQNITVKRGWLLQIAYRKIAQKKNKKFDSSEMANINTSGRSNSQDLLK